MGRVGGSGSRIKPAFHYAGAQMLCWIRTDVRCDPRIVRHFVGPLLELSLVIFRTDTIF